MKYKLVLIFGILFLFSFVSSVSYISTDDVYTGFTWDNYKNYSESWSGYAGNLFFTAGNIGIGTDAPNELLEVNGNIKVGSNAFIKNSEGEGSIRLTGAATVINEDGIDLDFRVEGDSDANLFVVDAGLDRVGIGTTSPLYNLQVAGNFSANNSLFVGTDGRVGIGTDSPSYPFDVVGNARISGLILIPKGTDGIFDSTNGNYGYRPRSSSDDSEFLINGGVKMTIDSSGNIGIGTGSPNYNLQVAGNFSANNSLFVGTDGRVGIGTSSPDYKLQVNGDIVPETNATYDLGTSVLAWDNVFAVTYNDLTPAWLELDGSALESISKITNDGIEINHTSYPMKLRSKYFIIDTEENRIRQVEIGINKTTNETIYGEENYTEIVKKEIKVDESLSLTDQEDYVVSKIGATKEEVQTGETIFTRDVGGTLTMIVESIKELFNWNTEQDLEIEELKQENIMMKEDLCSLGITRWCKVVLK